MAFMDDVSLGFFTFLQGLSRLWSLLKACKKYLAFQLFSYFEGLVAGLSEPKVGMRHAVADYGHKTNNRILLGEEPPQGVFYV